MKFLIIDDNPADRELIIWILQRKFYGAEFAHVIQQKDFDEATAQCNFNAVIMDCHLGWASGLRIIKTLRERFPYVPVIMVTDTKNGEVAVEGMKSGLSDFLLKKNLCRLPGVIKECLEKAGFIRKHDEIERLLKEHEEQLNGFFNNSSAGMAIIDSQLRYLKINELLADINGRGAEEHIGKTIHDILPKLAPSIEPFFQKILTTGEPIRDLEVSGETLKEPCIARHWTTSFFPIRGKDKKPLAVGVVVVEITGRKRAEETLRETMELFRQLVENIHEVFYVYSGNWKHVCYISPSYENVWGCTSRSLYEQPLSFMNSIHPDDREHVLAAMQTSENTGSKLQIEYRIVRPDKSVRWIYDRSFPILDAAGQITRFVGIAEDVTEHKLAEKHLHMQYAITRVLSESATIEEAFSRILQAICEALEWDVGEIWIVDQKVNILRCVESWHNPSFELSEFKKITAQTTFSQGIGLPGRVWASAKPLWIADVVPDTNFPRSAVAAREGLHGAFGFPILSGREVIGVIDFFSHEIQQPDDALLDMMAAAGSQIGQFIARKQSEALINHMAYHDTLTNLPNRILFQDRLQMAVIQAKRNERMVAVMVLDLDCFKTVNDTFGHHTGDLMLKAVAGRLTQCVREGDTIARMGGDEFMIVLLGLTHVQDATLVAKKFSDALHQPFQLEGRDIHITASIGISLYPSDAGDTDNLIKQADIAMYRSKECGRNTYRFYKDDMNTHAKIPENPAS